MYLVPTQVEHMNVNSKKKTITWAAPAEPNGIIVGYRVQYWELGRRDTAEDVNTTAEELVFSYSNFSKYSITQTTLTVNHNSNDIMTLSIHIIYSCRSASQGASASCHCSRSWGEQSG